MIEEVKEIPGVFTIASKTVPTLFITAPLNPKTYDLIYLDTKIAGTGRTSQQQMWRLIPGAGDSNSVIQNYASGVDQVIDVRSGITGVPIQLYSKVDNANQAFYIDVV